MCINQNKFICMALFGRRKIGQVQIEHEQWKFDNAKLFNFYFSENYLLFVFQWST